MLRQAGIAKGMTIVPLSSKTKKKHKSYQKNIC